MAFEPKNQCESWWFDIDKFGEKDEKKEGGRVMMRIQSLDHWHDPQEDEEVDGFWIPPIRKGTILMNMEGGFMFEKCLLDHPLVRWCSNSDLSSLMVDSCIDKYLVLVTFFFSVDSKLPLMLQSFVSLFLGTAVMQM